MKCSRYGSASCNVASASSSLRWRRKQRMSELVIPSSLRARAQACARPSITVPIDTPRAVCVCGSKKISAWTTLSAAARRKYAIAIALKSSSCRSTLAPA